MADIITHTLPALFIACVECFEIIQFGRALENDRSHLEIRLHYLGMILARWGLSRNVVGPNIDWTKVDPELEGCRPHLNKIMDRFAEAQRKSDEFRLDIEKHEMTDGDSDSLELEHDDADPAARAFCDAAKVFMHKYATKYQNAPRRTKWAVYEPEVLDNLRLGLHSDIVKLYALNSDRVTTPVKKLIRDETKEVDDKALPVMLWVSEFKKDQVLELAVQDEMSDRAQHGSSFYHYD